MQRYILDADDELRFLQSEDGAAVALFGGRRMLLFDPQSIGGVTLSHHTAADRTVQDALRFTATDPISGKEYEIYVPQSHADFAAFTAELQKLLQLSALPEAEFLPQTCDQNGHHE